MMFWRAFCNETTVVSLRKRTCEPGGFGLNRDQKSAHDDVTKKKKCRLSKKKVQTTTNFKKKKSADLSQKNKVQTTNFLEKSTDDYASTIVVVCTFFFYHKYINLFFCSPGTGQPPGCTLSRRRPGQAPLGLAWGGILRLVSYHGAVSCLPAV